MFKRKEKDLLISLILGDGSILKYNNSYNIYIGHGESQKDYLQWKTNLINNMFEYNLKIKSKLVHLKETNKNYLQYFITKTSKDFKELYDIYYNNDNKKLTYILKNIKSDRSLAIWFMDDGSVFKRKRKHKDLSIYYDRPTLKLCTHCFTKDENIEIIDWFKRRYLINAKLVSECKRNKTYYYIRFNSNESLKIFNIIKPYIEEIPSMKYKFKFFYEYYKLQ